MTQTPPPVVGLVDTCGFHNSNMEASTIRIIQGASWKRQNVAVLLPGAASVPMRSALAWMHHIFPPNQRAPKIGMQDMEVGDAYSQAIEYCLVTDGLKDCEFVLTLEWDNLPPQDGTMKLLAQMDAHPEFSCIGGLYWTKGYGGVPQIWGDPTDPIPNYRPQPPRFDANNQGQLVECCGTGMGFNLWRMSMFRDQRLARPLFRTKASVAEGVGTQDLSFWGEARKYGYRCAIDCDVKVGHLDLATGFVW